MIRKILYIVMVAISLGAASFDCTKAGTKIEKMICGDAEVSAMDSELGGVYRVALENVNDKQKLKQDQRDWMNTRDSCESVSCLKQMYQIRISYLEGFTKKQAQKLTLSGSIVSTHNPAGGGYGIQTQEGVYGLCYTWDDERAVKILDTLLQSGQVVQISGKPSDKWSLECDSLVFPSDVVEAVEPQTQPIRAELKVFTGRMFGVTDPLFGSVAVPTVDITAIVDSVTIKNVVGNKGNCRMYVDDQQSFPKVLKYGQKVIATFASSCNLIRVDVVTNKGTWIFEF